MQNSKKLYLTWKRENQTFSIQFIFIYNTDLQTMKIKTKFRQDFEDFCRLFNAEKSFIMPLTNVNIKTTEDLNNSLQKFIEKATLLSRVHYMTQSQRNFNIEELTTCFQNVKCLTVAQSLRIFARPNHKDRYSQIIQYLIEHPTVFAQIVYFNLVHVDPNGSTKPIDDQKFFCYSTIPAMYLFFLTQKMQKQSQLFVESLFQLHFYLHQPIFSTRHNFLKDIIFSIFVSTNPANFFTTSILPILPTIFQLVEEYKFTYSPTLNRSVYWAQVVKFISRMFPRMEQSVIILPNSAKLLINSIIKVCEPYPKTVLNELVFDTLINRYILSYFDFGVEHVLEDITSVIRCISKLPTVLSDETILLADAANINTDRFINLIKQHSDSDGSLTEAMKYANCSTLVTSRDLSLVYRFLDFFMQFKEGDTEESKSLDRYLSGISLPIADTDTEYLQLRISILETALDKIKMLPTAPFDEVIDIINTVDITKMEFSTPEELQTDIYRYCQVYLKPGLSQKITIDALNQTEKIIQNIQNNHAKLKDLSNSIASALFVILQQLEKYQEQYEFIINIVMKKKMIPSLIAQYPRDFLYNHQDLFSAENSINRLITTANNRMALLKVTKENEARLMKSFFEIFIDQIDIAFNFQFKVKTNQILSLLRRFLELNSKIISNLHGQKQKLIRRSSSLFQNIHEFQKISTNLAMALSAVSIISQFPDDMLLVAIAQSDNPAIFSFVYFTNKYLNDERIAHVMLTEADKVLIDKLRKACQYLREGNYHTITLDENPQ